MPNDFGRFFYLKPFSIILAIAIFQSPVFAMRVVIDAGHGGTDRGTTRGDITESAITLTVAKLLRDEMAQSKEFSAVLTRADDSYVSLEQRAEIANEKGDVFISIHVNSSTDPKARGKEIYFQNQLEADEESLYLANLENGQADQKVRHAFLPNTDVKGLNSDVKAIVEDLERNYRLKMSGLLTEELHRSWGGDPIRRKQAIRQAPFFVISNVNRPAALIEIGFLTNPTEAKKLVDASYQKKIAQGIFQALIKFKEVVDNTSTHPLN